MPKCKASRILVVKPSSLGDILHMFPALEVLHRAFPGAELDYLVHPSFSEALDYSPWRVSRRILFERGRLGRMDTFAGEFRKLASALRERRYDYVIDFQGLFRSAFFARLAAGRSPVVGFAFPRENSARWFYSVTVPTSGTHAVERNAELAGYFLSGGAMHPPELPVPPVPPGARPPAGMPKRYLLLLPGARWRSKMFPAELFAGAARLILERFPEFGVVVAGGAGEAEAAEQLCRRLTPETINVCGRTSLTELFEMVRGASGIVCNDSGPLHIAALMRRPVCAFFGPTRPEATGPWGAPERFRIFRNEEIGCLECMRRECRSGDYWCFNINVRRVADEMCAMLAENGG